MRIKPVRERNPVAVGVVGLLVLALIGLAAYRADSLPFIGGGTTYSADFTPVKAPAPSTSARRRARTWVASRSC